MSLSSTTVSAVWARAPKSGFSAAHMPWMSESEQVASTGMAAGKLAAIARGSIASASTTTW